MTRVRFKLNAAGRVAFVRVEDESVPMRGGWQEIPGEVSLFAAPSVLAVSYGFDGQNTARRLLVELMRVPEFADELAKHDSEC